MFLIVGIIILVVSFVIAFVSLIREEKNREKQILQREDAQKPPDESVKQVQTIPQEAPQAPQSAEASEPYVTTSEPFPWLQKSEPEPDIAQQSTESEPAHKADLFEDRFPQLGEGKMPLSGSFKIGDIAKKR